MRLVGRDPGGIIDLERIRDELDELASRRRLVGLMDSETKRYRDLCRRERELLAKAGTSAN